LVRDSHEVGGVPIVVLPLSLQVRQVHCTLVRGFDVGRSELRPTIASEAVIPNRALALGQKRHWTDIVKRHVALH
jgi:hypothetical protein